MGEKMEGNANARKDAGRRGDRGVFKYQPIGGGGAATSSA